MTPAEIRARWQDTSPPAPTCPAGGGDMTQCRGVQCLPQAHRVDDVDVWTTNQAPPTRCTHRSWHVRPVEATRRAWWQRVGTLGPLATVGLILPLAWGLGYALAWGLVWLLGGD